MGLLLVGIMFLIANMMVVMGLPFIYYLKHDAKWLAADNKTLELWYH